MQKLSCLKWTYRSPGIDYRVALLFTRYLTALGIIPESLKLIGQFYHAEINKKDLTVSYGRTYERTLKEKLCFLKILNFHLITILYN